VSEERWWSTYAPLLKRFDSEDRNPALGGILAEGSSDERDGGSGPEETVDFGLQRVLDRVEAFVRTRSNRE
jgi:hypothetical protein